MQKPDSAVKNILKEFKTYGNGPAVDAMQRMGLIYEKNYGVSISNLREIAKSYQTSKN